MFDNDQIGPVARDDVVVDITDLPGEYNPQVL